ncbi:hypothetical protein ACIPVB_08515 [Microbacterium sp. NPDC090007]|uniref:hypothetical protein n=1 Tax=Microbacterium sp. NPDC090007 TaxID=3364204 RepID=UPI003813BE6A
MRSVFFSSDPVDDDDGDRFDGRSERIPSFEPPRDEIPVLSGPAGLLARADDVVIALMGVRVFSDGVEFLLDRHLRRGGRDPREWQLAQMDFAGHFGVADRTPGRLRWGLSLGDGQRLLLDDPFGFPHPHRHDAPSEPQRHTVRVTGGGGSGGGDDYTMHDGLWLWPLPPEGPLDIVVQWTTFGVAESRFSLDGGHLRALAAGVRPLWE